MQMKRLHMFSTKSQGTWRLYSYYQLPRCSDRERLTVQLEVAWLKKVAPGFRLHFGNKGSETPIDAMLSLGFIAFFWGIYTPKLGQICEWLGRGHKRDISLKFHGGQMWWRLWYDDDGGHDNYHDCNKRQKPIWPWSMGRAKYRSWMCLRDGNIELNPLDAFWGHRYYGYHDLERTPVLVTVGQFPGDIYLVHLTLQRQYQQRQHGPWWARRVKDRGYGVEWQSDRGIPVRNHSWKGDEILGSGVNIIDKDHWITEAKVAITAQVIKDRERYNYQPLHLE